MHLTKINLNKQAAGPPVGVASASAHLYTFTSLLRNKGNALQAAAIKSKG